MKTFNIPVFVVLCLCLNIGCSSIVSINRCVAGSYWNNLNAVCQTCSTVTNSNGASSEQNSCGCLVNYKWNFSTQTCDACTSNCPSSQYDDDLKCAIGSYFNIVSGVCATCSSDTFSTGVSTKKGCVCQTTPTQYYWNSQTQICTICPVEGCPVQSREGKCPSTYYLNRVSKLCVLCSSDSLSTGVSSQNGCLCSNGNYWNQNTQSCSTCPNGICPTPTQRDGHCLDGSYFNSAARGCLLCTSDLNSNGASTSEQSCGCNTNFYWDRTTQICIACSGTCPSSRNNGKCATGSYFNVAGSSCQTCGSVANSNGASTRQNSCGCLSTFYWNKLTQICDSCGTTCPTAPTNGRCPSGSYLSRTVGGCLVCPTDSTSTGASGSNNNCVCTSSYFWNFNTQICTACAGTGCPIPVRNQKCLRGYYLDNASQGCLACSTVSQSTSSSNQKGCVCSTGYYWNQATDTCISCPNGVCPRRRD